MVNLPVLVLGTCVLAKVLGFIAAMREKRAVFAGARSCIQYPCALRQATSHILDEQVTVMLVEFENGV